MRCYTNIHRLAVAAVMLVTAAFSGCSKTPAGRAPTDVSFYWTCDARGRLEPCGCFTGQHGGLTRVRTLLNASNLTGGLLADAGNAIAGPADYQVIQYRYMLQAFAAMGYSALNVGEREAQLPADELKRLRQADGGVALISVNLVERDSGRRIFEPYKIVETHGWRVAFIGALGDVPEENLGAGLRVEPAKSAIAKILPEVKKSADAIVLLAFADEAAIRALADSFYEFDAILGGKVKEPSQHLTQQNQSVVVWTTNETKALGMLKAGIGGKARFAPKDFNIYFINDKIPQDAPLAGLSQAYREEIRKTALAVDDPTRLKEDEVPGIKSNSGYVGSESCGSCHAEDYKIWRQTGHARAFRSLTARKSDADPNCIGCHTVGFGTPTGYRRAFGADEKLTNVGCESCHGPGSEHVTDVQQFRRVNAERLYKYRPVGAADCTSCHYGEFSRPFAWETFWPQVKHGAKPPPAPAPPVPAPLPDGPATSIKFFR